VRSVTPTSQQNLRAATWRVLTAAAAETSESWPLTEHASVSAADVRAAVGVVADAVRQVVNGDDPITNGIPAFVPARRVLERLRRAFFDQTVDGAVQLSNDEIVVVLRAFERVQEVMDTDAAHRFAARLSAQDAQQLVVEMAHDMRSPLGSILILAERLRAGAGGDLSAIQQRQLGLIYSAASA
jgi:signal transduction histidine kinase